MREHLFKFKHGRVWHKPYAYKAMDGAIAIGMWRLGIAFYPYPPGWQVFWRTKGRP